VPLSGGLCLFCFGFGGLRKSEPFLLPARFVTGFDQGAGAGDIKYVTAALLRLRYEAERLSAEGMGWREEVKHWRSPRLSL
jgi:hypothetical protein